MARTMFAAPSFSVENGPMSRSRRGPRASSRRTCESPSPLILPARDLAEIQVDVTAIHALTATLLIEVLEEHLARQLLTVCDDPRDAADP
jgi:hypothetical protein